MRCEEVSGLETSSRPGCEYYRLSLSPPPPLCVRERERGKSDKKKDSLNSRLVKAGSKLISCSTKQNIKLPVFSSAHSSCIAFVFFKNTNQQLSVYL